MVSHDMLKMIGTAGLAGFAFISWIILLAGIGVLTHTISDAAHQVYRCGS